MILTYDAVDRSGKRQTDSLEAPSKLAAVEILRGRGLFDRRVAAGDENVTAAPMPVAPQFRSGETTVGYPRLGEANDLLDEA